MDGFAAQTWFAPAPWKTTGDVEARPQLLIIDDDHDIWEPLIPFLHAAGLGVQISDTVPAFSSGRCMTPTCLILDVGPGGHRLNLQQQLVAANIILPIIIVTGFGDVAMSVRAMKNGAVDFICKPFRDQDVFKAVELALARDRTWCAEQRTLAMLSCRFEMLSQRERQVMAHVVTGHLNKQVAADLGISEITVKAHRGRVMRKMKAGSVAELTRMSDKIAQSL